MLTQERLKELLVYDPDSGIFVWRVGRRGCAKGNVAGSLHSEGYVQITIDRKLYLAHRLVWLYVYGETPEHEIDHINHDRSDNSLVNLRAVSCSINMKNQKRHSSNTSGFTGVHWHKRKKKWQADIVVDGKYIYLGSFVCRQKAINARLGANLKYGFHGNHGV